MGIGVAGVFRGSAEEVDGTEGENFLRGYVATGKGGGGIGSAVDRRDGGKSA